MSEREPGLGRGPEVHGVLAYLSRPLYPLLRRVQIRREGRRKYDPSDVLLPEGYVAEVVATGFKTPVHCCFDDRGFCYVTECSYKIESRPQLLRVDVETGDVDFFLERPQQSSFRTRSMSGTC